MYKLMPATLSAPRPIIYQDLSKKQNGPTNKQTNHWFNNQPMNNLIWLHKYHIHVVKIIIAIFLIGRSLKKIPWNTSMSIFCRKVMSAIKNDVIFIISVPENLQNDTHIDLKKVMSTILNVEIRRLMRLTVSFVIYTNK